MKKRILSLFLTLCMVLTLLPTAALAAAGPDTKTISIGGAAIATLPASDTKYVYGTGNSAGEVTENANAWGENTWRLQGPSATTDPGAYTLTLRKANISVANAYGIETKNVDLIIELPKDTTSEVTGGIHVSLGDLTIRGEGVLNTTGYNSEGGAPGYGICVQSPTSDYVPVNHLTIEGGTTTAMGGIETQKKQSSYGVYAQGGALTISGGHLTGTGGETTGSEIANSCGIYISKGLTVSGGRLTGKGGAAGWNSCGVWLHSGDFTLSGGVLEGTGKGVAGAESYSVGIYFDQINVNVSGGSMSGTSGDVTEGYSAGIYLMDSQLYISGNGQVTGTSNGKAKKDNRGIHVGGDIMVSDNGILKGTGGQSTEGASFGVYTAGALELSGSSSLLAQGGQAVSSAPNMGTYTAPYVTACTDYSGTNSVEYDAEKIATYPYLRVQPKLNILAAYTGKPYDGQPMPAPTKAQVQINDATYSNATLTPLWYADSQGVKGGALTDAPINAGDYWVSVCVKEGGVTVVESAAVKISITKAPLTITGGTVTEKTWNGSAVAPVSAVSFIGLQHGETLTFQTDYTVTDAAYADAAVAANKAVTAGTVTLANTDTASNYSLADGALNGKGLTGTIVKADSQTTPTAPTGEGLSVTYGDSITFIAEVGPAAVSTLALGDDVAQNKVAFYCGDKELGTVTVNYSSDNDNDPNTGTATLDYETSDRKLAIGGNTVTAYYGGSANLNGSGSESITVTLNKKPLASSMIADIPARDFTGHWITPSITVTDGTAPNLIKASDFSTGYGANTNAGTDAGSVTITATDSGYYSGSASKYFTITPKDSDAVSTSKTVPYSDTRPQSVDIAAAVASLKAGTERLTYFLSPAASYTYLDTENAVKPAVDDAGSLTFQLLGNLTEEANGQSDSILVDVTGLTNYTKVTVTVTVNITKATPVTVDMTDITLTGRPYNGEPITYTGVAAGAYQGEGGQQSYTGGFDYQWYKDETPLGTKLSGAPSDAGDYILKAVVSDPAYKGEDSKRVSITAASQDAPTGLGMTRPTTEGGSDGTITGLDSAKKYQYKLSGSAGDYTTVAAGSTSITGLAAGAYLVRLAGDSNHDPSPDATVTVKHYAPTIAVSSVTANGADGTADTTQLTITLGTAATLTADNITLTGANKGLLTGGPTVYTLAVSGSFANKADVTVALDSDDYVFDPDSTVVTVYRHVPVSSGGAGVTAPPSPCPSPPTRAACPSPRRSPAAPPP